MGRRGPPPGIPKTPGSGRKPGTPNKVTGDIREMIRASLDAVGGRAYLERQAEENPKAYLALVGRVVPQQVNTELSTVEPLRVQVVTGFDEGAHER